MWMTLPSFSWRCGIDASPELELQKLLYTETRKLWLNVCFLGTGNLLDFLLSQVVCLAGRGLALRVPFLPVQGTKISFCNVYLSENHSLFFFQQMSLWQQPYASCSSLPPQATHCFLSPLPVTFLYCRPASE